MFSIGAINGAALNVTPLAGGHMEQQAIAAAMFTISAIATPVRRLRPVGVMGVSLGGGAAANRRQRFFGAASVAVLTTAFAHGRTHGGGTAPVAVSPSANGRKRLPGQGVTPVEVGGVASPIWRFIHRAPARRTFILQPEQRSAQLPRERRTTILL